MRLILTSVVIAAATLGVQGAEVPQQLSGDELAFFNGQVLPILKQRCYECHSHEASKIKGGLTVDSRDGLLKGGETGPAIIPGDATKSLLLRTVRYEDDDLQMPPKEKLSADQIAILEKWVKMGAPDPRISAPGVGKTAEIWAKSKDHWAFKPVANPQPPKVKNGKWARTPIDNFILAKLEDKGVAPSPQADKFTLIRRVTFDLTGLPPTADEVAAFLKDKSPEAYKTVVDRLLASPHYGERWARYWLDVARYADTTGESVARGHDPRYIYGYTYRDYVINAFNQDKPYDRFVIEQLAADKVIAKDATDLSSLAALGFITIGKRFTNFDEVIDDRIDAVSRAFMGMTVSCGRCHDHKFDPIPQEDYYSWHGIFSSIKEPDEGPVIEKIDRTPEYEDFVKQLSRAEQAAAELEDNEWNRVYSEVYQNFGQYLGAIYERQLPQNKNTPLGNYFRIRGLRAASAAQWNRYLGTVLQTTKKHDPVFSPWVQFAQLDAKTFAEKAPELAKKIAANADAKRPVHPLVAKLFAGDPPKSMTDVNDRYAKLLAEIDKQYQDLRTEKLKAAGEWKKVDVQLADADADAIRKSMYGDEAVVLRSSLSFQGEVGLRKQGELDRMWAKANDIKLTHPGSPDRAMVVEDLPKPRNSRIFIRGDRNKQGPEVKHHFLSVLAGPKPKEFTDGSGRLELAQAIVDPTNPLTARVMVNRIWMHHFGQALVNTPSDFGLRGEPPTHPELLDYMARYFMDHNWSIKSVHRLIVLSATYQQKSEDRKEMASIDPGNALLWRFNRRRLDFEAMRDTLLTVSGSMDPTVGGRSIDVLADHARRTIYSRVDRLNLPGVFTTFDFALPDMSSPQRFETTVPTQALFMMNSPFVIEQAKVLAARPELAKAKSDDQRIRAMYKLVFQREPSKQDLADGVQFISEQSHYKPEPDPAEDWHYGMGSYGVSSKKMYFYEAKKFANDEWVVYQKSKDQQNRVTVDAKGGSTGSTPSFASIRRWVSPVDGAVAITGSLTHKPQGKDTVGVKGRIILTHDGKSTELGTYDSKREKAIIKLDRVVVQKGDTIDFVAIPLGTVSEAYRWSPTINLLDLEMAKGMRRHQWLAEAQFGGPRPPAPKGLNPWEKYAQALLLTNELVYVD